MIISTQNLKSDEFWARAKISNFCFSFRCEKCGKAFGLRGQLKQHMLKVHEGTKDYKCEKCDSAFILPYSLKTHIKLVHDAIREFQCDKCEKTQTQNLKLWKLKWKSNSLKI